MRIKALAIYAAALLGAAGAPAQEGKNWGNYRFISSAEIGWRFVDTDGSLDKYRSDVNLRSGPRLFGFSLDSRSLDHRGKLYDGLHIDTSGWGGDPGTWLRLRMEKNRAYKFDMNYRRSDYFNSLREFALAQHNFDAARRMSDFNLTLFPDASFKINLGYSRNSFFGASFTTFDFGRDEFQVLEPLRRTNDDYRVGVDWTVKGIAFSFEQGLRKFRNDRFIFQEVGFNPGNNPTNATFLSEFRRLQPVRGLVPITRFSLRSRFARRFDFTGRFVYSDSNIDFSRSESLDGVDFRRARILENILSNGFSGRPNTVFDLGLSYSLLESLTLNNTFRYNQFGIAGTATARTIGNEISPGGVSTPIELEEISSRFTGVKSSMNLFAAEYRPSPRIAFHVGYRFSHRVVRIREIDDASLERDERTTLNTNTLIAGMSLRLARKFNATVDYENGGSDNAFTRVSPYDFSRWRVRFGYRPLENWSINGAFSLYHSSNPTPFAVNRFDNTGWSISIFYAPAERFALNLGYNRLDIDSEANIIFFIANRLNRGRSLYFSNTDLVFADLSVGVTRRLELAAGYRLVRDAGIDRADAGPNDFFTSFPLAFHRPSARLTIRLSGNLKWNVSYDHYSYNEKRLAVQDYHANLLYTSLQLGF